MTMRCPPDYACNQRTLILGFNLEAGEESTHPCTFLRMRCRKLTSIPRQHYLFQCSDTKLLKSVISNMFMNVKSSNLSR